MSDTSKLDKLLRHIKHVQDAALVLGERLMEKGETEFGRLLIANSMIHDNSKFFGIEWEQLNGDADPEILKIAVHQHQKTNPHHPEYWNGVDSMPRIYLAEMVCDWFARSLEFGTSFREWVTGDAMEKYGIKCNSIAHKRIKEFVCLLVEEPFKIVKAK